MVDLEGSNKLDELTRTFASQSFTGCRYHLRVFCAAVPSEVLWAFLEAKVATRFELSRRLGRNRLQNRPLQCRVTPASV